MHRHWGGTAFVVERVGAELLCLGAEMTRAEMTGEEMTGEEMPRSRWHMLGCSFFFKYKTTLLFQLFLKKNEGIFVLGTVFSSRQISTL